MFPIKFLSQRKFYFHCRRKNWASLCNSNISIQLAFLWITETQGVITTELDCQSSPLLLHSQFLQKISPTNLITLITLLMGYLYSVKLETSLATEDYAGDYYQNHM